MFQAFPPNITSIQKSPWNPHKPMEIDLIFHSNPIPISMGIPSPTAAVISTCKFTIIRPTTTTTTTTTAKHRECWAVSRWHGEVKFAQCARDEAELVSNVVDNGADRLRLVDHDDSLGVRVVGQLEWSWHRTSEFPAAQRFGCQVYLQVSDLGPVQRARLNSTQLKMFRTGKKLVNQLSWVELNWVGRSKQCYLGSLPSALR